LSHILLLLIFKHSQSRWKEEEEEEKKLDRWVGLDISVYIMFYVSHNVYVRSILFVCYA